jgi:hypothetical protein
VAAMLLFRQLIRIADTSDFSAHHYRAQNLHRDPENYVDDDLESDSA